MDDDFDIVDISDDVLHSHPWRWGYVGIALLRFSTDVVRALSERMADVSDHVGSHINYQLDQAEFHAEVAQAIETLTEAPKE